MLQIQLDRRTNWPTAACSDCVLIIKSAIALKTRIFLAQTELEKAEEELSKYIGDPLEEETPVEPLSSPVKVEEIVDDNTPQEPLKTELQDDLDEGDFVEYDPEYSDIKMEYPEETEEVIEIIQADISEEDVDEDDDIEYDPEPPVKVKRERKARKVTKSSRELKSKRSKPTEEELLQQLKSKAEQEEQKKQRKLEMAQRSKEFEELNKSLIEKKLLICKECTMEFDCIRKMNAHAKSIHNAACCVIVCCDTEFRYHHVLDHMRYHKDKSIFSCKPCNLVFKCRRSLLTHLSSIHEERCKFQCEVCGKKFIARSLLKTHVQTHVPIEQRELKFECKICVKKFTLEVSLKDHIRTYHSGISYFCEKCGKKFPNKSQLKKHDLFVHQNIPKEKKACPVCLKEFTNLTEHFNRIHGVKKTVHCDECGKEFSDMKARRGHMKSVHPKELHTCQICQKDFKLRSTWKVHMDIHNGVRSRCYFCPFEASSSANRSKHMWQRHKEEYEEFRAKKTANYDVKGLDIKALPELQSKRRSAGVAGSAEESD